MPYEKYQITREIGIDSGHRIPNHHSKCRNLHGHRYRILATLEGATAMTGSVEGMAGGMDFGFFKDEMMSVIDSYCDHALVLCESDPLINVLSKNVVKILLRSDEDYVVLEEKSTHCGKIYVMKQVPTAENLANHWYMRLAPRIEQRSQGAANLLKVRVFETPNCYADVGE